MLQRRLHTRHFQGRKPRERSFRLSPGGFFAAVKTGWQRVAHPTSGKKNYHEYSTRFWEGLCGESRIGEKTKQPDLNKDGKTSLAEAHAYVVSRLRHDRPSYQNFRCVFFVISQPYPLPRNRQKQTRTKQVPKIRKPLRSRKSFRTTRTRKRTNGPMLAIEHSARYPIH